MKAVTTIEKAEEVLIKWLQECDAESFCAVFDYAFGTKSCWNEEADEFTIEPGAEDKYGGIIEQEFKKYIRNHQNVE